MTDFKKIFHLMESIDATYKNHLINEISIIDKYNKEKDKNNYTRRGIDFDTFEELCNMDPTTKPNKVGKYCNWLIAKYNPNVNFNELKRCLEWFADGIKRNILSRYGIPSDINSFKTYEELINAMNSLNDDNDDLEISSSEYNNRNKLEGQFEVLGSNSFYDIIAPKTFAAERYFGGNTDWCTVANDNYYKNYMKQGQLYILYPKNGDSEYKMQFHFESDSFADEEDEVYDNPIECFESVIDDENVRNELIALCKKVFTGRMEYFLTFEEAVELKLAKLQNGVSPTKLFDRVSRFTEGFAIVEFKYKYNFINKKNEILSPDLWFDDVWDFHNGFAIVSSNYGLNFIDTKGEILCPDLWFEDVDNFEEGFAKIVIKGKGSNFINTDGNFLCPNLWFTKAWDFKEGLALVCVAGKGLNYINTKGEILRDDLWFNDADYFNEGFACVRIKNKGGNFINTKGEILRPDFWFDNVDDFMEGYGTVVIEDRTYDIDANGTLYDMDGDIVEIPIQESKMNIIKLTENDLHNVIKKSVKKVLKEYSRNFN